MNHLLVSYHTCPMEEPGTGLAGGMNVLLRRILPGLSGRGIETVVLTRGTGRAPAATCPFPGVRIVHVPCGYRRPFTRERALLGLPAFVAGARRLLAGAGARFDVVSAHYWMSGVAALDLLRGGTLPGSPPLVFAYHTVEARKERPAGSRPDRLYAARTAAERRLARLADRVVCFTRFDLSGNRKVFPALSGKGAVVPPGVDEAFRRPPPRGEARLRLGIPPGAFVFLAAARADPGKNVAAAAAALLDLRGRGARDAVLLVAGQGPPPGRTPEGIRYAGPVPHAAMPGLYAAADAVLCPSPYESFGLVPLEAQAAGVPIVVPEGGYWGARVRRVGGGVAYDPGRPEGPAEAMGRLYRDAMLSARLREEARRAAAPFTWEKCTASWARILATASRRRGRRSGRRAPGGPRRRAPGPAGAS